MVRQVHRNVEPDDQPGRGSHISQRQPFYRSKLFETTVSHQKPAVRLLFTPQLYGGVPGHNCNQLSHQKR